MVQRRAALRRAVQRLLRHQVWAVGVIEAPIHRFLDPDFVPSVQWYSGLDFAADPFAIQTDDGLHILFEDFAYVQHRGRISSIKYAEGQFSSVERGVLENDHHLSYPFCVEQEGLTYCFPENSAADTLVAYVADDFPRSWRPVGTMLSGVPAVDPTLIEVDGRWWLFCTRQDHGPCDSLWIYTSDELLGPWTPHEANPVKTNPRSARPAGGLFWHDGALYRPAQDCSRVYGGAIVINRIDRLNSKEFAETEVRRVLPIADSPNPKGIHTISGVGDLTVIDGMHYTFSQHEFRYVLRDWASRLLSSITR